MYNKFNKIHFIGIGGIGMSGIAELLHRNGYKVTGSDLSHGEITRHLEQLGVPIFLGHRAENIEGADLVVYSSAVRPENPEFAGALQRSIPAIPRAEMLAELMRIKYGVAVAGAHGKTTTTSLISMVLVQGGLDPTIVVGGRMDNFGGTNARLGSGDFMVVEADESDGSFNKLSPSIAVVTNMDREHMDFYKNMRTLKAAFVSFMNKVPFYGLNVLCVDDPYLKLLMHRVDRRKKTYGFSPEANYRVSDYTPTETGSSCRVTAGKESFELRLRIPGKHNVCNALAALIVGDELGVPRSVALDALGAFQGVQRRFQRRGNLKGVQFIDDYAHHPSEIRATLRAAREQFPKSNIRVVFQPHRYSRMDDLLEGFANSFSDCDAVAVTDIYSAGEKEIPGVNSSVLVEIMHRQGKQKSVHAGTPMQGVETWLKESVEGDVILTLGAGDLPSVYRQLF